MTTNHRPTFESRRGREITTNIIHKRSLPAHKQLKYRKEKQALDELKKELLQRESKQDEVKAIEAAKNDDSDVDNDNKLTYEEKVLKVHEEFKSIDDSDDSLSDSDPRSDDDDEDDDEELLRELEKIKKEKASKLQHTTIITPNPLLDAAPTSRKKNWRQGAIFSKPSTQKQVKDHVNDILRSEFHQKFMDKYIR